MDAKKAKLSFADGKRLLAGVDYLSAAKGKKVVHLDLRRGLPSDEELSAVLLGPTGNLRAPLLRVGRHLLVGFASELYASVLLPGSETKK